eukprot:TRINITY_DN9938_c0_g2_i1.p1 TRINITY_DN9938_c0_g2~~TRINITY_DN9938_c0_g2_i1.p1  ORF type:complete len:348 (+),score=27.37 TRINITY_DN9938_c0_g2_i1:103-1044(+)
MPRQRSPDVGGPAMFHVSTIKATPRFSFGKAGLRPPSTPLSPHGSPLGSPRLNGVRSAGSLAERSSQQASSRGIVSPHGLDTPGPGAYQHRVFSTKPARSSYKALPFGCSASTGRLDPPRECTPGPGDYDASLHVNSARRPVPQHSPREDAIPGAGFGSSTVRKISPRSRASSPEASTSSRAAWCGSTPGEVGPGAYDHRSQRMQAPKFATSPRFESPRASSPGPGWYEPNKHSPKAPKVHRFSITGARSSLAGVCRAKQGAPTPGPGTYDLAAAAKSTRASPQAWSMGTRRKEAREASPGPGDYGGAYTMFR